LAQLVGIYRIVPAPEEVGLAVDVAVPDEALLLEEVVAV
jgi:hypothetical protein